ncbi:MAG: NAD(P)H-quinone oxidoreductase subunit N, partial [Microcoleaceae cyanobacterium]
MDFSSVAAQLNAGTILPEGIVIITLLVVLVGDLIVGRTASARWTPYAAIAGLLMAMVALYFQWDRPNTLAFLGSFDGDALSVVFRGIIALSAVTTILMSVRYVEQTGTSLAEYLGILLTATLGAMFLSGADELAMIFI